MNNTCISSSELIVLLKTLNTAYDQGIQLTYNNETALINSHWDILNAVFFATTVITTIGKPQTLYLSSPPEVVGPKHCTLAHHPRW